MPTYGSSYSALCTLPWRLLRHFLTSWILVLCSAIVFVAASCGGEDDSEGGDPAASEPESVITVYSGRNEELIGPVLQAFSNTTGHKVEARYGSSSELALLIQTEGKSSPADVFISQSPGALGLLAGEGLLIELNDDIVAQVPERYAASDATWVGITGRVRVVVYNRDLVESTHLPASVLELTEPFYVGRVAVAPANSSFQDFVTAMRNELGDDATRTWLEGMATNGAPNYPKNSAIVEAVGRGEVEMGLVNHYYNLRALEADPSLPSVNHYLDAEDLGSLVIITGAAVLGSSDDQDSSQELLEYLLSEKAQGEFVAHTQEYPLVEGVEVPQGLPPLAGYAADTIDYELLGGGLGATIELIRESGIKR